jgi:AcrR family transcriptional regulator
MDPQERREAIVEAALAVALRKGLGSTTVRDVAAQMGTSSGLIHHYFGSMDDVLAAAFERVAEDDLRQTVEAMAATDDPLEALAVFFRTYAPVDKDRAFQFWLDAWAEAGRRPPVRATSRRLNLAWQSLLRETIERGVAADRLRCVDPAAAAWRLLSLVDGLALQVVAHGTTIRRSDVLAWATGTAESELGLPAGTLSSPSPVADAGAARSGAPARSRR